MIDSEHEYGTYEASEQLKAAKEAGIARAVVYINKTDKWSSKTVESSENYVKMELDKVAGKQQTTYYIVHGSATDRAVAAQDRLHVGIMHLNNKLDHILSSGN